MYLIRNTSQTLLENVQLKLVVAMDIGSEVWSMFFQHMEEFCATEPTVTIVVPKSRRNRIGLYF